MSTKTEQSNYKLMGVLTALVGWVATMRGAYLVVGDGGLYLAFGIPLILWGISTINAMIEVEGYQAKIDALNSER